MASTISSIDSSILKLAPTFQTAIRATIDTESTPLKKTQALKDSIEVRKGIYTDVKTNFDALQKALQALISTQDSFGMNLVSKATVTPGVSGSSVLSVTTEDDAAAADYEISGYTGNPGIQLARAQSKATSWLSSADAAAGKSGDFWLGGTGTASARLETATPGVYTDFAASLSVTAAATSAVASGQRELGTGTYNLETRDVAGIRQFRLVDADGEAVSIRSQAGSSYTAAWQNMSNGSYDTGRGLALTLNAGADIGSTALPYTAAGTVVTIAAAQSLRDITTAINAATQPEGRDLKASIVANKLVLTSAQTGENHDMLFTDNVGLGSWSTLQLSQNAKFNVNGVDVSRAGNSGLTDVIDGVTLNLASDAAGKTAHLSVSSSSNKAAGLMNTLVSTFNTALTHLKDKLASTTSTNADGKLIYTRGPLTGDTGISSLRYDLLMRMNHSLPNSGSFKNLAEIGLSLDKDNKLVFDSAKFTDALTNHGADLTAVMDAGLNDLNTVVSRYAGSSGTLSKTLASIDEQRAGYDKRIAKYNEALTARKQTLYNQYIGYQNQLVELNYQQQMLDAMYGTSNSTTSTSA